MMVRFDEEESSSAPISVRERMVNQQLLLQNEYLLAENRILRAHLPTRLLLTDPERFVLHDRDSKLCSSFQETLRSVGIQPRNLPARSPNLNAFAERWVRSVKSECLSKLILFGEASLPRAITQFIEHYHLERPHQGKGNQLLFPSPAVRSPSRPRKPSNVSNASVVCSSSINALHEYF
jgi:hypothetical protein